MTPAQVVIHHLGVRPLARKLGVTPGCIVRWRTRGGSVPHTYQERIIELSEGKITAEDLVHGREDA